MKSMNTVLNPLSPDTDGEGFADGQEIEMGTDPLDSNDPAYIEELAMINFNFDRSDITDSAAQALSENVETASRYPGIQSSG